MSPYFFINSTTTKSFTIKDFMLLLDENHNIWAKHVQVFIIRARRYLLKVKNNRKLLLLLADESGDVSKKGRLTLAVRTSGGNCEIK